MEKKSFVVLVLVLSMVIFSSVVLANIAVTGVSVVSPRNVTNSSAAKVVLALKISDTASGTLDSLIVSATNLSGQFTADGDLAPLSADSSSGIQIYKDSNSNGVYDAGTDSRLTYTASDWTAITNYHQNVSFSGISGLTLPSSAPSTANVFIIIRTAAAASDVTQFNVSIESNAIKSSANSTGTIDSAPIGSGQLDIDTTNPSVPTIGGGGIATSRPNVLVNDTNRNGYVDQIRIQLTEAINDSTVDVTGFSVGNISNFTVNSGYLASGVTFWTGPEGVNDNIFYLNFTEIQQKQLRMTNQTSMAINYSTNGSVKDLAGNSLAAFPSNVIPVDAAGPVVIQDVPNQINGITTFDTGNSGNPDDGRVDAIQLIFSEPINDSSINLSSLGLVATNFTIANGSATGQFTNDEQIRIVVNQPNGTVSGNFTGLFSVLANKVGLIKDRSILNDNRADELDNWMGNITNAQVFDQVAPVIEGIRTVDSDNNGWLDAIRINFSEPVNDSTISAADVNSFNIIGEYDNSGARQNMTGHFNLTSTYFGDIANNNYIYLNFSEAFARFNTSGAFRVNYTSLTQSSITDLSLIVSSTAPGSAIFQGITWVGTNTSNTLSEDRAAPVIMSGLTYNITQANPVVSANDSTIDYINLTLSERVVAGTTSSSLFSLSVNTNNGSGVGNVLVLGTNNVTIASIGANVTIGLNGLVVGTGNVTLNYTVLAGASINDSNGNTMLSVQGVPITDNMRPVLYSADYMDNDSNGYADSIRLNFTEPMNQSSAYSAVNLGLVANKNFSVQRIGNDSGENLNYTANMNNTGTSVASAIANQLVAGSYVFLKWAGDFSRTYQTNGTILLNMSGTPAAAQTNTTPAGGNVLSDTSGNGVDFAVNVTVNDRAPPVIYSALTYDTTGDGKLDGINITLSENPSNAATATMNASSWSVVVTDGKITRKNILTVSSAVINPTGNVTLVLNGAIPGTGNVTLNYTMSQGAGSSGNINDSAGNVMDNVLTSFAVIDNASPVIMNRFTLDNDSDGWVEMVGLNFSEEINDSSIAQQLDQSNKGLNTNFSVELVSKEGLHNLNWTTGTTANDAVIYLNWSTTNTTLNATYNTSATPVINFTVGVVSDTKGVLLLTNKSAAHASVKAADQAVPRIMGRFTVDRDANGFLDAVGINFSENVVDETFNTSGGATNNASNWNISLISGNNKRVDFTTNYNGDTFNNNIIYLNWTFADFTFKTNGTPTVNFTAVSGNLSDAANNKLATVNSGTGAEDRVAPRIMNITTIDSDSNGWLDAVKIYWSEPINDMTVRAYDFNVSGIGYSTATAVVGAPDSHALNYTQVSPPLFTSGYNGDLLYDDIIYLNWSFNNSRPYLGGLNTGATPQVNYTAGNLSDLNNVLAATNTTSAGTTALDRAVPIIMDVFTVDNNTNGYLDAVGINWSESINDQSFTNVTNFNISKINSIASALRVDFNTNFHGDSLNNNIMYLNWTIASTTFNTSERPLLNYTAGNLSDLANNLAPTNSSSVTAQDRAAPGIIGFVASDNTTGINGYDSDDTLTLSFSEAINNASLNNNSVFLVNGSNTDGLEQVLAMNNRKFWNNISSALWINANQTLVITLHAQNFTNISVGDVVTPNATMRDAFGNLMGLSNATLTGTFDDTTPPQIVNLETQDNNSNGKIDAIKITFSETVLNHTYNSGANNATSFITGFSVGYDAGTTFTVTAGQNDSGAVILLNLTEKSAFNTSIRPWVFYTTSQGNITDMGTNANRLASFNLTANDSAAPVVVNVSTFDNNSNGMIDMVNVTFSEEINDSSINSSNLFIGSKLQLSRLGGILFNTRTGGQGTGANDSFAEFSFADNINNSGEVPEFVSNGTSITPTINFVVQDLSTTNGGNFMKFITNTTVTESDGAKPVFRALNASLGNFSNTSKLAHLNSTTLWFNVSEPVVRLVAVVGNVTLTLQNNESAGYNYTYTYVASRANASEGNLTITLSALDTSALNGTNATQAITTDFTAPNALTSINVSDRPNDDGKQMKVFWSQTPATDFARYRVYLDVNPFTTSIAGKSPHNVSFTTVTTTRTAIASINSSNLTDGNTYYVAVTAVDDVGNENTTIVTNGSGSSYDNNQINMTVNDWNFVSTTQTLANTSKLSVMNSSYTAWYYNATSSAWESPNVLDQYRGYWVYDGGIGQPVNLSYKNNAGVSPTLGQVNLTQGWNAIGASHEASTYVNTTLLSIAGKYSVVYEYTPGTGWRTYTPGVTTADNPSEFINMTVGRGYWIYMTSSASYSGGDL